MFVSFQDFVGKNKELFCLKAWPDSAEKRDILNTGIFGICEVKFNIGNLFIGELFITSESGNFSNSETIRGREEKEK